MCTGTPRKSLEARGFLHGDANASVAVPLMSNSCCTCSTLRNQSKNVQEKMQCEAKTHDRPTVVCKAIIARCDPRCSIKGYRIRWHQCVAIKVLSTMVVDRSLPRMNCKEISIEQLGDKGRVRCSKP